jgi:hypothetical protein
LNLLDLVPSLRRHLSNYIETDEIDSELAAYIADGIEALQFRWDREYAVDLIPPLTYSVTPDIESKDKRPIILMASIIYKMGKVQLANFSDGDFSYSTQQGRQNPIQMDIEELARFLPIYRLARPSTAPLRGYNNIVSPESYIWLAPIPS